MKPFIAGPLERGSRSTVSVAETLAGRDTSLFTTDEIREVRSSQQHGWQDLLAIHTLENPHETRHGPIPFFWLSMGLRDTEICRVISGRSEIECLSAYSVTLAEPLVPIECSVRNATEAVHVFIKPTLMYEVAGELFEIDSSKVSIRPVFGEKNNVTGMLLRSIKQSLTDPASVSQLKIDYLSRALCADLLSKFTNTHPVAMNDALRTCRLTSRQLRIIDDYLNENISRPIHISKIAALCELGRTTFHVFFKNTMYMTPHQYLIRKRVAHAKKLLTTTKLSLAEISYACGFSDQAHFAMIFKRVTGMTASAFRRENGR